MGDFKQIDVHAAREMLDKGGVTIVDIRDDASFQQAHIAVAISVNDQNIKEFIRETDKDKPLICYCYHGISSQSAASFLKDHGFKDVYSMIGGFEQWQKNYLKR